MTNNVYYQINFITVSPILEHTGGLSGNLGVLRTFPSRSNVGGYVHADLNNPSILGMCLYEQYISSWNTEYRYREDKTFTFDYSSYRGYTLQVTLQLDLIFTSNYSGYTIYVTLQTILSLLWVIRDTLYT